jgi:hypothetical protein
LDGHESRLSFHLTCGSSPNLEWTGRCCCSQIAIGNQHSVPEQSRSPQRGGSPRVTVMRRCGFCLSDLSRRSPGSRAITAITAILASPPVRIHRRLVPISSRPGPTWEPQPIPSCLNAMQRSFAFSTCPGAAVDHVRSPDLCCPSCPLWLSVFVYVPVNVVATPIPPPSTPKNIDLRDSTPALIFRFSGRGLRQENCRIYQLVNPSSTKLKANS